jgi:hypothetical protein
MKTEIKLTHPFGVIEVEGFHDLLHSLVDLAAEDKGDGAHIAAATAGFCTIGTMMDKFWGVETVPTEMSIDLVEDETTAMVTGMTHVSRDDFMKAGASRLLKALFGDAKFDEKKKH